MEDLSRRALFAGICAIAVSGLSPLPVAAASAVKKLKDGKLAVQVKAIPELSQINGSVAIGQLKGVPIAITRTGASSYSAFSLACPHQGVTVERDAKGWFCPAHNSQFKEDGGLILGPATKRLTKIPAKLSRGVLTIG